MADYYPSSSRITTWSPGVIQGVVGGIPSRSGGNIWDVQDYGWGEAEAAADNTAAFNAALAASSEGDIIEIPAGEFDITSLSVPYSASNRTVRGAGMGLTILNPSSGTGVSVGSDSDYGNAFNPVATITAMTANSNVITVADGSGMPSPSGESTYRMCRIQLANESTTPIVEVAGRTKVRSFAVLLTGRSGNTLTLAQPLPSGFADGLSGATIECGFQLAWFGRGIGIEDLTIDGTDAAGVMDNGLAFNFASGCWAKNVKVLRHDNYGIKVYDCTNTEIRRCWIDAGFGGGSNRSGLLYNFSSYGLIEDNIVVNNGPNFEINFSSTANVFSYNYLGDGLLNCNHGAHNSYNLYEGNICWFFQADGYFGGCSEETDYRNWMQSGVVTNMKRFTRNRNIIGNIVGTPGETYSTDSSEHWGTPNIANNNSVGTAEPSTGDWWADWNTGTNSVKTWTGVLTTRTSDTAGVITLGTGQGTDFAASLAATGGTQRGLYPGALQDGIFYVTGQVGDVVTFNNFSTVLNTQGDAVTLFPSAGGFQEKDLDVANTTIRKGNYYVLTGDIPSGEALGGSTLADSYAYATEPGWWGDDAFVGTWPPFDPASPGTPSASRLPAGVRHGATPPEPEPDPIITPLRIEGQRRGLLCRK